MFHTRTHNNRINQPHQRGLRLICRDTLIFQELIDIDGSLAIHTRIMQDLVVEMYKVVNDICPEHMIEMVNFCGAVGYELEDHKLTQYIMALTGLFFLPPKNWEIILLTNVALESLN